MVMALMLSVTGVAETPQASSEQAKQTTLRRPMFQDILEASRDNKKGVTITVRGQNIVGIVEKVEADCVHLKSREYSKIVVRMDSIDAVSIS
jgi:sRNA-binding regulator protein Hfq